MVYQQEDVQSDSIFSPTIVAGCVNGMRKRGPLRKDTPGHPKNVDSTYTIIGFDPAVTGRSAFVAVSYNRSDGKIYVLDFVNMVDPTPQKENALIKECSQYSCTLKKSAELEVLLNSTAVSNASLKLAA
jgi:hypothetical protein